MNKKAMGIGQIFIFIVAAITFALVTIFGFKAITGFVESGEEVAFVQFKTELESSIRKIYTEYDSVRKVTFKPPVQYSQICFVDFGYDPDPSNPQSVQNEIDKLCLKDALACDAWELAVSEAPNDPEKRNEAVDQNVFMKPSSPVTIKVRDISIYDKNGANKVSGFLCKPIRSGRFPLIMIGKGDRTGLIQE